MKAKESSAASINFQDARIVHKYVQPHSITLRHIHATTVAVERQ